MTQISLDVVGAVTGILGTLTGVASLVWHMINSKPKIKLVRAYFVRGGFGIARPRGHINIGCQLKLRNLGNRSVTIENVSIQVGNHWQTPTLFKKFTIPASTSEEVQYDLMFEEDYYKKLFVNGELEFKVFVEHTFDTIKKSGKTDFKTGYFTIS